MGICNGKTQNGPQSRTSITKPKSTNDLVVRKSSLNKKRSSQRAKTEKESISLRPTKQRVLYHLSQTTTVEELQKSNMLLTPESQNIIRMNKFYDDYSLITDQKKNRTQVLLFQNNMTGMTRAVKIQKFLMSNQELKVQAQQFKQLDHPNIIQINDFYAIDKRCFIVMEYCRGLTLRDVIDEKQITNESLKWLLLQVLSAILYMNSLNQSHNNLSPDHIIYTSENSQIIKLISFKSLRYEQQQDNYLYQAPEVFERGQNIKSDIWSLGLILYEIATGANPFYNPDQGYQTIVEHIKEGLTDKERKALDTDQDLKDLILNMLEVNIEKRFTVLRCLHHKFLAQSKPPHKEMFASIQNMQTYRKTSQLQFILQRLMVDRMIEQTERDQLAGEFLLLDSDFDGKLTPNDLLEYYAHHAIQDREVIVHRIFDIFDLDRNKVLDFTEFLTASCNKEDLATDVKLQGFFALLADSRKPLITQQTLMNQFQSVGLVPSDLDHLYHEVCLKVGKPINFQTFKQIMLQQ